MGEKSISKRGVPFGYRTPVPFIHMSEVFIFVRPGKHLPDLLAWTTRLETLTFEKKKKKKGSAAARTPANPRSTFHFVHPSNWKDAEEIQPNGIPGVPRCTQHVSIGSFKLFCWPCKAYFNFEKRMAPHFKLFLIGEFGFVSCKDCRTDQRWAKLNS